MFDLFMNLFTPQKTKMGRSRSDYILFIVFVVKRISQVNSAKRDVTRDAPVHTRRSPR